MFTIRRKAVTAATAAALIMLPSLHSAVAAAPETAPPSPGAASAKDRDVYTVPNTDSKQRTEIAATGAQVLSSATGEATVEATRAQAEQLRQAGFTLEHQANVADALAKRSKGAPGAAEFPPGDEAYHTYDEVQQEMDAAANDHPEIAAKSVVGKSFEGKDIPMMKISNNVAQDEDEPEVLFNCNIHAREHLTTEMCMRIIERFTDNYPDDPTVAEMVDSREIWVIPVSNPDGSIYDYESGQYQGWRKNRQDQGTDLNRNFGYKWGCCGGSSGDPASETYRGEAAFSAPETQVLRDFAESRRINGEQQLKGFVDFHTFSELVLWPFGHTEDDVTEGMTQEERDRFERVGTAMAETNGYTPQQSSDLYVTDGDSLDYMWGEQRILSFTFEMYPSSGGIDGFYPPGDVIERETARNDEAVDIMLREAGAAA